MTNLVHSTTGLVHLASALAALVLGIIVLTINKGTRLHKTLGYAYFASMLLLNGTALAIYHLFGRFGPFHWAALLSLATLMMGFLPALLRRPNWLRWHTSGMYYSVVGLYAAFASEVVVRIPGIRFFEMVGLATAATMFIGVWIFKRKSKQWLLSVNANRSIKKEIK